jgi:hypothetical protein
VFTVHESASINIEGFFLGAIHAGHNVLMLQATGKNKWTPSRLQDRPAYHKQRKTDAENTRQAKPSGFLSSLE